MPGLSWRLVVGTASERVEKNLVSVQPQIKLAPWNETRQVKGVTFVRRRFDSWLYYFVIKAIRSGTSWCGGDGGKLLEDTKKMFCGRVTRHFEALWDLVWRSLSNGSAASDLEAALPLAKIVATASPTQFIQWQHRLHFGSCATIG